MYKEEIKYEINKVLDHFSDKALQDLLEFLKELESKQPISHTTNINLERILPEDNDLHEKLAK